MKSLNKVIQEAKEIVKILKEAKAQTLKETKEILGTLNVKETEIISYHKKHSEKLAIIVSYNTYPFSDIPMNGIPTLLQEKKVTFDVLKKLSYRQLQNVKKGTTLILENGVNINQIKDLDPKKLKYLNSLVCRHLLENKQTTFYKLCRMSTEELKDIAKNKFLIGNSRAGETLSFIENNREKNPRKSYIPTKTSLHETDMFQSVALGIADLTFEAFKERLEKNNIDPNLNAAGIPLLFHVCISSKIDTEKKTKYLLQKGANPNIQAIGESAYNDTAAHILLANERYGLVQYLINTSMHYTKQDLDIQDSEGKTLLLMAIKLRHTGTAKYLIDLGADIDLPDNQGRTPLHMAAIIGNSTLFSLLLENGADLHCKDKFNRTPLNYLAMEKNERKKYVESTLKEMHVTPTRDEKAMANMLIDSQSSKVMGVTKELEKQAWENPKTFKERLEKKEVEPSRFHFFSTKLDCGDLLAALKDMKWYQETHDLCSFKYHPGDEQFIIKEIESFTGRSIEDACLYDQGQLFYKHKEELLDNQTVKLLNRQLIIKEIKDFSFKAQEKLHMQGVVDAVIRLPKDKNTREDIVQTISSILPKEIEIHQYTSQGKNYLMISDINTPEKGKAIWKHIDNQQITQKNK